MGLLNTVAERLLKYVGDDTLYGEALQRAFVIGKGVVNPSDIVFGKSDTKFSPAEYGNYIATSNAVYACATGRANLLSALPLKLYRVKSDGNRDEVKSGALYALMQKVNPFWTLNRLIEMTELSLCLWGKAFWFLERGNSGRQPPREIWWARPDRVRVIPDAANYIKGFVYTPVDGSQPIPYEPGEVIWFRYPNPLDEYEGLSPLAAARLAADYASAAMTSNRNLFVNGIQAGGYVTPKAGTKLNETQAREIEEILDKRMRGIDKAHRWSVFRFEAEMKAAGMSPKDAEFIGGMTMALEDVARAYHWPLDLIGGRRTYENVDAAMKAAYTHCVLPESRFVATDMTEQLLPMFGGQADVAEFDASDVEVLKANETAEWERNKGKLESGVKTINEIRELEGDDPVPWGDVWWTEAGRKPVFGGATTGEGDDKSGITESQVLNGAQIQSALSIIQAYADGLLPRKNAVNMLVNFFNIARDVAEDLVPAESDIKPTDETETARIMAGVRGKLLHYNRSHRITNHRAIEYDSDEHKRLYARFTRRLDKNQREFKATVKDLFERQRDSVLARLSQDATRTIEDAVDDPFDLKEWIKRFRQDAEATIKKVVGVVGADALDDLDIGVGFDIDRPEIKRFMLQRAQRFAKAVNETTWNDLRSQIAADVDAGKGLNDIMAGIRNTFDHWIDGDPAVADKLARIEMIARTETLGATTGGTLEAWKQSEVVEGKEWLSALIPNRTRDDHAGYHSTVVGLDEDFEIGGCAGPGPGLLGCAEQDINCLCTFVPKVKENIEAFQLLHSRNGHTNGVVTHA